MFPNIGAKPNQNDQHLRRVCGGGEVRRSSLMPPKKGAGRGRSLGRQVVRALNTQDAYAAADQYIQDQQAQAAQEQAAAPPMPPPASREIVVMSTDTTSTDAFAQVVGRSMRQVDNQGGSPTIMVGLEFPESP